MELLLFRVLVQFQPQIPISEFARPVAKIVRIFLCWEKYCVYRALNLGNACRAEHRESPDLKCNLSSSLLYCDGMWSFIIFICSAALEPCTALSVNWLLYEICINPLAQLCVGGLFWPRSSCTRLTQWGQERIYKKKYKKIMEQTLTCFAR